MKDVIRFCTEWIKYSKNTKGDNKEPKQSTNQPANKQQHPFVERQNTYYQNKIYLPKKKTPIIYKISNGKNNNKSTHSKKMMLLQLLVQCNNTILLCSIIVEGRCIATIRKINSNFTSHRT